MKLKIWNYRNISMDNPLELEIKKGITFIMGVNNVGKSNLLRFLFDFRNILSYPLTSKNFEYQANSPFDHLINRKQITDFIKFEFEVYDKMIGFKVKSRETNWNQHTLIVEQYHNFNPANTLDQEKFEELKMIFSDSYYIGPLRSSLTNTSGQNFDVSVGTSFLSNWSQWADSGNINKMRKVSDLKSELKTLFGFKTFDIRLNATKDNLIITCDDDEFLLNDMGSGISQFIIVLVNALIRQPQIILIDEPELNLHPRLQEVFVQALAAKCKYGLIATSHSIGLARSSGSDSIYSLSKDTNNKLTLSIYGDSYKPSIINTVSELGYSQFVELGGNNILLVEGATDIKCFKEILRKYNIDQHFIIIDLGGSSLISKDRFDELNEIKRLNAKSYNVIFDSEISKTNAELSEKLKGFKIVCDRLGFNVFPTEYHSTDNYLTQDAINKEVGEKFKELSEFENFNDREGEAKWQKNLNWKMFRGMSKTDFEGTKLEEFIMKTLVPLTT